MSSPNRMRAAAAKAGVLYQETPHTPGPWRVVGNTIEGVRHKWPCEPGVVPPADARVVAVVRGNHGGEYLHYPPAVADANAELIAQAPTLKAQRDELLAALKEYRKAYGNCGSPYQQQAADMADAAIAKAEGR